MFGEFQAPSSRAFAPEQCIRELATEIGPRPATSTAEARAAAAVGAYMRQVSLEVSVQTFSAAPTPTAGLALLAALSILAAILGIWTPLPSLALTLLLLLLAIQEIRGAPTLAALLKRQPSQNVIGTRAAQATPRGRIVLLCHLDSPRVVARRWQPYVRLQFALVPCACVLLALCLLLRLGINLSAWWLLLPIICSAGALILFIWRTQRARWTNGAVDAAGIATALHVAEQTQSINELEVWVVALGAGAVAGAGLRALLDAYPFPQDQTWFINLAWLGRGTLSVIAGEGWWRRTEADQEFVGLFHELRSLSAPLDRRGYRGERLDSTRLLQHGYHALSLVGLRSDGTAAGFRRFDDLPALLDLQQITIASRLISRALAQLAQK